MHEIKTCRSCKSKNFITVINLGNQYLSRFTDTLEERGDAYPLEVVLCQNCYLVQLKHTVNSSLLYSDDYGYKSGISGIIRADLTEIALNVLGEANLQKDDKVLDIASNDGELLSHYPDFLFRVGCDPLTKYVKDCQEHADVVVNDFFSRTAIEKQIPNAKFKAITAISCFYDMEDPNTFVKEVASVLEDDGIFVVQQNYLVAMLQQNAFCNIVHEHLEYYSLLSLENLLERHNLMVYKVELNDINGGSFRTYICKKDKRPIDVSVTVLRLMENSIGLDSPLIYEDFAKRIQDIAQQVREFIESAVAEGKTVYTLAASTRGNTLLQYIGLDNTLIKGAMERNPGKFGKYVASVGIPIVSEEEARKENPNYLFVLPWFFKKELLVREADYLKKGGSFIFPLPQMEIINGVHE